MKKNIYFYFSLSFIFIFLLGLSFNLYANQTQGQRFKDFKEIKYNISFNGIPSGYVVWSYLGKEVVGNRQVYVLSVKSDTNILKFLDLVSSEKIYLDCETHLPVKVKRDIKMFGDKEIIREKYNQKEGKVTLIREKNDQIVKEEVYEQDVPIHNILDLLYFFPKGINLEEKQGKWMSFNLPNQKVQIKFHSQRKVKVAGKVREAYFLVGKGARRFNLWLSLDDRIPLRLDFISLLGKVIIRREENEKNRSNCSSR
ncbi:MAG: hypothetical protein K9L80_01305 [Candidatus Omnitrophica bacterium]|nr:hypothetical protein [Candidatus Omnitrophota bacterium]MCF7888162.1 hypothetical protein [Candidatus Omnitrophota bacterium]